MLGNETTWARSCLGHVVARYRPQESSPERMTGGHVGPKLTSVSAATVILAQETDFSGPKLSQALYQQFYIDTNFMHSII